MFLSIKRAAVDLLGGDCCVISMIVVPNLCHKLRSVRKDVSFSRLVWAKSFKEEDLVLVDFVEHSCLRGEVLEDH